MWSKARVWNHSCYPFYSGGQHRGRPATLGRSFCILGIGKGQEKKRGNGSVVLTMVLDSKHTVVFPYG